MESLKLKEFFRKTFIGKRDGFLFKKFISKGDITKREIKEILKNNSPVVLEIGANDGKDSLEFLKTFEKISLHCFEPDPQQIKNFEHNISNSEKLRKKIQEKLSKTHRIIYNFPFAWENWRLKNG